MEDLKGGVDETGKEFDIDIEKEELVSNLNQEQEDKLREAHARNYNGTDDDMPDAFENWLIDLDSEELKSLIK